MEVTIRIKKEDERYLFAAANLMDIKLSLDGKDLIDEERFYKFKTNAQNIFRLGAKMQFLKEMYK